APPVAKPGGAPGTSTEAMWLAARLGPEEARSAGEVAELLADPLDLVFCGLAPELLEAGPTGLLLGNELAREGAAPDVLQQLAHRRADVVVDHHRAAREVAVLGDVRNRVAHVGKAALVDQVDDQLHLVDALV